MESIDCNELSKAVQMESKTSSRAEVCRENIKCAIQQGENVVRSLVFPKKGHDIVTIDDEDNAGKKTTDSKRKASSGASSAPDKKKRGEGEKP